MTQRSYKPDRVCGFRYTRAAWGEFSNFWPLPSPIEAGPWRFRTSEALYQAAKFPRLPDVQERIARAPTTRAAKTIGRSHPIQPDWNAQRVNAMRWVLRMKYEANARRIDEVLARSGDRPIVEVSAHDPFWGARSVGECYLGCNALGRLWMELRQQLRNADPLARSGAWVGRVDLGRLSGEP